MALNPSHTLHPLTYSAVRIGVTGHRTLKDPDQVRTRVEHVLAEMDDLFGPTTHGYRVLSPLAEGADRLVAQCVLEWRDVNRNLLPPQLELVLPMPEKQYFETFSAEQRAASIAAFHALAALCDSRTVLPQTASRNQAFEQVGKYIVKHCDLLIAIWDGEKPRGQGGTAQIVEFALANGRTTFWINCNSGVIDRRNLNTFTRQVHYLRQYNAERPGEPPIETAIAARWRKLADEAQAAGLDVAVLDPLKTTIVPHLTKASRVAQRWQNRHFYTIWAAYALGACAIATAALGVLIFKSRWFFYGEALEILGVVGLINGREDRVRKWIDYRYLAERLRASCFLYVAGLKEEGGDPPPDLQLTWLPHSWVSVAIRDAWNALPPLSDRALHGTPARESAVNKFLQSAWIDAQRKWYQDAAHKHNARHELLERCLKVILVLTLLVAIAHAVLHTQMEGSALSDWLAFVALTFPAVASAIAGISVFGHFDHNAERYDSMSRYLAQIGQQLSGNLPLPEPVASTRLSRRQQLIREADRWMAHEHQGWRFVFGVRLPGPG